MRLDKQTNDNFIRKILLILPVIVSITLFYFSMYSHAHAASWFGEPIYQVLGNTGSGMGKITSDVWTVTMNVVNSFVLALLIYVAFMNILRIQMDSYAVKKFLPTFIMTIILANFSFLIARIIIDLGNIAISIFLTGNQQNNLSGVFDELITQKPIKPGDEGTEANYYAVINAYIFKQFFVIGAAVMMFILSFIFLVRNYMLYFLIAIAPLGFLAMALPITKKYFQQWWGTFTKWVFMPVVSVFWLWLGGQFVSAVDTGYWILPVAFGGLCLYMAITSPFKIGGAVLGAWTKFGKQAWGKTGGAAWKATGGQVGKYAKDSATQYYDRQKGWMKTRFYNTRMGKTMMKNSEAFKLRNEMPSMILENQRGTARKQNAWEMLRDPSIPVEAKKRLRSKVIRPEVSSSLQNDARLLAGDPNQIATMIKRDPLTDAAGNPLLDRQGRPIYKVHNPYVNPEKFNNIDEVIDHLAALQKARWGRRNARTQPDRNAFENLLEEGITDRLAADGTVSMARPADLDNSGWGTSATPATSELPQPPTGTNSEEWQARLLDAYRRVDTEHVPADRQPSTVEQANNTVLADYMRELVDEFRNLEQQFGGKGSLGGEGGYDQLLGEISKMKPNLTLSDAGLATAILPVMKVRIESMDPTALEQWGRKIRQVSEGVNKMTAGIEAENASVLRQIAAVIRNGANPSKLAEGRQAIGEAADTDEGEGNG